MTDSKPRPVITTSTTSISQKFLIVNLNQLCPHPFDLRTRRNPMYDTLKASIRERGLEVPLSITQRPHETHYRICSGGNTRLTILHELWSETEDDRFLHIHCCFHPWPARGELILLTGYLANNRLRSDLTFVEQALGITKARHLYEKEAGATLNLSELADRLAADGYPVTLEQLRLMVDTVSFLLPAIPNRLYNGLGHYSIKQLTLMRWAAQRIWVRHAGNPNTISDFSEFFRKILSPFDTSERVFALKRVWDALIGQMSERIAVDYDLLTLELLEVLDVHDRLFNSIRLPEWPHGLDSGQPTAYAAQTPDHKTGSIQ